ncbi:hypothetical protein Tco_1286053 [Tanacetum coccineum]
MCVAQVVQPQVNPDSTIAQVEQITPFSDVHQVGDEREVKVLRSFSWPPSELITDDGVLPKRAEEIPATDVAELGQRMKDFVSTVRQDIYEIYRRLDDAQDDRLGEARAAREAWAQSMDASDTARSEVRALQTTVLAQQTEIGDLRAVDRRRQAQLVEALTLLKTLQTQMAALQSQQRPARDPAHPDVPEEANSSS